MKKQSDPWVAIQIFISGVVFCIVFMMLVGLYHPHMLDIFKIR